MVLDTITILFILLITYSILIKASKPAALTSARTASAFALTENAPTCTQY